MVVVGYGGNDGSLMNYLKSIERRKGIYWCCRNEGELNDRIRETLDLRKDCIVEISGFDQLMLELNVAYEYPLLIDRDNLENSRMVKIALEKAERYCQQLEKLGEKTAEETVTAAREGNVADKGAVLKLFGLGKKTILTPNKWWEIQLKIDQEKDPDRKLVLYRKALEILPNSPELSLSYAHFLEEKSKDYDQAEMFYRKALELNPNDSAPNSNYSGLLLLQGKKEEATPYLEKALQGEREDKVLNCWFYRLAHYPAWREQARQEIKALLEKGVRSPYWDFTPNIERAVQDGYPDPGELRQIAVQINQV